MYLPQQLPSAGEQRINFSILENELMDDLCSRAANAATTKVAQVYLRLRRAPLGLFEAPGVMRVTGNGEITAWQTLMQVTGVASETMNKALKYLRRQGIIGYWAGKNGTGIRIWFNLAASSLREKSQSPRVAVPTPTTPSADEIAGLKQQLAALCKDNQKLNEIVNNLPDKEWLLSKGLPKLGRVFFAEKSKERKAGQAQWSRVGQNKDNEVRLPELDETANEAIRRAVEVRLAAFSPDEILRMRAMLRTRIESTLPASKNWENEVWERTIDSALTKELSHSLT